MAKNTKQTINDSSAAPAAMTTEASRAFRNVAILGTLIAAMFVVIWLISDSFRYASEEVRPIAAVVGLFMVATLLSFAAIRSAIRCDPSSRALLGVVILLGVSFRCIMVFTTPILEIDLYRYMWDGKVQNTGVSPYRFSPQQVLAGNARNDDAEYAAVVALSTRTETLHTLLSRIHYSEYSTIYPPVSQFVFATTMRLVPDHASVETHLIAIKTALVLFDVGTLLLVLALLMLAKLHVGWLIAYAWNPLVIKEIANSGHLDSIAVFFTVAAILGLVVFCNAPFQSAKRANAANLRSGLACSLMALLLAAGTGAKLFPVVLFPAFLVVLWRRSFRWSLVFLVTFVVGTALLLWPMAKENPRVRDLLNDDSAPAIAQATTNTGIPKTPSTEKIDGLSGFLTQWRINDLIFSFIYDNARPDPSSNVDRAWYILIPNETRQRWFDWVEEHKTIDANPAFLTARSITLAIFSCFYLIALFRLWRSPNLELTLNQLFLIFAVFFLLLPTQNPWYWLWAMPLIPFAQNRGWLVASLVLFIYYLRFWFSTLEGEYQIGSFRYSGLGLFDYCVSWLETGSIFIALIAWRWFGRSSTEPEQGN